MNTLKRMLLCVSLFGLLGASWPLTWMFTHPNPEFFGTKSWLDKEFQILHTAAPDLDANVLRLSLNAYVHAREEGIDNKQLLTIIDYSKPSTQKRLWVFDVKNGREVMNTWVAHGKNSGNVMATSFSNRNGSLKSSLGVFVTAEEYEGKHGGSLRLKGLEKGFNDNAYDRDIVFHGAAYIGDEKTGRSWGCPAVKENLINSLVDTIKGNTVVFAYYPDSNWLRNSKFLV